jgi:hypothetical protein
VLQNYIERAREQPKHPTGGAAFAGGDREGSIPCGIPEYSTSTTSYGMFNTILIVSDGLSCRAPNLLVRSLPPSPTPSSNEIYPELVFEISLRIKLSQLF